MLIDNIEEIFEPLPVKGNCSVSECNEKAVIIYGEVYYCEKHWEQWVKIRKLKNKHRK